jgi:hypothetical protein
VPTISKKAFATEGTEGTEDTEEKPVKMVRGSKLVFASLGVLCGLCGRAFGF